ncbi:uncharacterized protein GGS22DRAFT_188242 [Annulohypoxylon maeteangense]|uniref:uncharacterized protein n=1 Tax=Annulohypoxylon maeteangense TaxID=1927788 RepID=UPI002008C69B|nr:uncharacterized protein GGS22DRAFT_188242 [Annulohypoxylon maeteangense]KAI0884964.1 hypothetical protein GGS22DRAFT_188242 [Annulohypoxylon maeteangense]
MALSPWQLCFHTDSKCRVRTCNNKRIITSTVFAPYCGYHICSVCLKQKTFFKRGHGEERICHRHSCTHPTCHAPRSKKHPDSPYCTKHACNARSCDQPRQSPAQYCVHHTCRARGCVNGVHPPTPSSHLPDVGEAETDELRKQHYCPGHQPCQARGCHSLAFQDVSHRAGKYCFRHHCGAVAGCAGQRVDVGGGGEGTASACRDHTCALYPACSKPRVDVEGGLFCKSHECAEGGCRKQRYDSGRTGVVGVGVGAGVRRGLGGGGGGGGKMGKGVWCADHMCMAALTRQEDCPNRREGTPANPVYCADHELCEEVGCMAFCAVRGRGVRSARCEEHLKSKCAFPSCTLDAEGNAAACRYHVCRANGCITMLAQTITPTSARTSLFCDVHRCVESECVNPRLTTTTTTTTINTTAAIPAAATLPPCSGGNVYCAEHVHQRRMGLGVGFSSGLCPCSGGGCRHTFGTRYGGACCRTHGGSSGDDDDDSDDDDTITDRGGSSGAGVGLDIGPCFGCGGGGKCSQCVKC